MITCNGWLDTLKVAALCAVSLAQAAGFSFHLSTAKIRAGERATLELHLPAPPGQSEEPPPIHDDLLTQDPRLKILAKEARREGSDFVWRYDLTAHQPGKIAVPPVEVQLGAETFSTESLPLEVTTSRPPGDDSLRPEYGSLHLPLRWKLLLKLAGAVLAAYVAGRALQRYLLPRFARKPAPAPPEPAAPRETAEQAFRRRLAELRAASENGSVSPGELVDELTLAIRNYLERSTQHPVTAWTTRDIARRLATHPKAAGSCESLERCDRFKFSGDSGLDPRELFSAVAQEAERRLLACGT